MATTWNVRAMQRGEFTAQPDGRVSTIKIVNVDECATASICFEGAIIVQWRCYSCPWDKGRDQ